MIPEERLAGLVATGFDASFQDAPRRAELRGAVEDWLHDAAIPG